ncbi:major facilitator superfamily domain-containing protein [Xylaria scruposa]|nr:major facilitator superfamily domain-containing protein [Xylaria scruposa]
MDRRDSDDSRTRLLALPPEVDTSETPAGADSEERYIDDGKEHDTLSRIDKHIIPLLFATAMVNFMDKTILSSAAVFGLRKDTGLIDLDPGNGDGNGGKNRYAYVAAAFYVGYALSSYPAAAFLSRLPVGKFLGANLLLCGVAVAATALCRDFTGLLACRFALGVFEAAITPSLVFITGTWYTRDEIPKRTGVWFSGHSVGGIAASGLAFLVGIVVGENENENKHAHAHAWRWMFAILGMLTCVLGVVILRLLPDEISAARFLSHEERRWARDRVVRDGTGSTSNAGWKWDQARECLRDPQTWMICAISLCCQIPNGGTQNFANLVITALGFTPLGSTIINVPYSILCIAAISGSGWVAGRFRSMNCILIALIVVPPIVGSALISHRTAVPRGVSLLAYFLLSSGPAALPLLLSLVQSNIRGVTKKNTTTALLFVAYCVGNIVGPQLFVEGEAPAYATAFHGIVICYSLVVGLALLLRGYLKVLNRQRTAKEGMQVSSSEDTRPGNYDDNTDWNTFGFRYRL